ncbi:MAG: universal stress protein [wastewater metagenome]|nr:universal stress protein [Candidatus Loosdrechtia aerotolerans]
MISIKNILCPIDYSIYSEKALDYAIEIAERYQSKLILMHVLDIRVYDIHESELYGVGVMDNDTIERLKDKMLNYVKEDIGSRIPIEAVVVQGIPFIEIVKAAEEYQIDLIVMGTHGRTGISHALMGSIAEKVVRKSPCPVLTVKRTEHDSLTP